MSTTKNTKKTSVLSRILGIISDKKSLLAAMVVITAIGKIALAAAPKIAGKITDELSSYAVTGRLDYSIVFKLSLITAALYFIGNGVDGFVQKNMVDISQTLSLRLRNMVSGKLLRMPIGYLDTHPMGDLQALATSDIINIGTSVESSVPSLFGQGILLVGIFVMMFVTDIRLALIFTVAMPILIWLMLMNSKASGKLFDRQIQAQADLNSCVTDCCSNHLIVRAYNCEKEKKAEFDRLNEENFREYSKSRFVSGFLVPLGALGGNFPFIVLCLIGGKMMIEGTLTIGEFQAFIFYGNMLNAPLTSISSSVNALLQAASAMRRISAFLDEKEETDDAALPDPKAKALPDTRELPDAESGPDAGALADGTALPDTEARAGQKQGELKGDITFEHVRFGYTPEKILMQDLSFSVKEGETLAIVGPSGAGKTTLINLLMRFYDISGGTIRIDGKDTAKLPRDSVRKMFGMVLQDAWIFDGTIAENIGYGKPDASREEIIEASKTAYCDHFIRKLPNGYDTHISADHISLSSGEMQLLAIARCILSGPEILILDEATSQVDSRTEYLITKAMDHLMEGKTSFIIAHRLFTIKNADRIIFVMDGDIKEIGTHEELLKKGGYYAEMYRQT